LFFFLSRFSIVPYLFLMHGTRSDEMHEAH
jgi:hypothetical protein